jgi:hypothetical protein
MLYLNGRDLGAEEITVHIGLDGVEGDVADDAGPRRLGGAEQPGSHLSSVSGIRILMFASPPV